MLDFIRKSFSKIFEILLWLVVIGCTLSGLISGAMLPGGWKIIGILGGIVIGAIIGLLWAILVGGVISVLLNIDKNLNKLVNGGKSQETGKDGSEKQENNTTVASEN